MFARGVMLFRAEHVTAGEDETRPGMEFAADQGGLKSLQLGANSGHWRRP